MKRTLTTILFAAIAALAITSPVGAASSTPRADGDYVFCFRQDLAVDEYADAASASTAYRALRATAKTGSPVLLITTGDQTRRALVIYEWDFSKGSIPTSGLDHYVAQAWTVPGCADLQWNALTPDQRAGASVVQVEILNQVTYVLIFRTFGK